MRRKGVCVCVLRNAVWEGESSSSAVCAWGCTSYLAQLGLNVSWWQLDEGGDVLHLYTTVGLNQPHQVLLQQRSCVHMCVCVEWRRGGVGRGGDAGTGHTPLHQSHQCILCLCTPRRGVQGMHHAVPLEYIPMPWAAV